MSTLDHAVGAANVPAAPASPRSSTDPGAAPLAVLLAGTFLIVLDFFIVNVALPSIQRDLKVDATALEWLVAGYGLSFGALLLPASRLGDRHGRRRLFIMGLALFVLASAACGLAPGTPTLLLARLLQGAAAAMIGPMVLALIGDIYVGPARVRALGAYATVMGVAAASGQLIGGLLVSADLFGLGWRTIFLVNVPVGLAALALARRVLPNTRVDAPAVDVAEAVRTVGALTAVMLPLTEGRQQGWPAWTWCSLAAGVLLGVLTIRRGTALRRRGRRPLLDSAPLRHRPLAAGLVGQFALFTGMASYFLVLALYLQQGRGLTALGAGLVFTILAVSYMTGTRAAPRLAPLGARTTVTASAAALGVGHMAVLFAVAHIGVGGSIRWLVPGLAISGVGMGVALASLVGAVMGSVEPRHAGTVSGTSSTLQQLGNALGVALIGIAYFGLLRNGVAAAFAASLLYLVGTTLAVALAGLALPGRPHP
jgi:predicted MFS family arabinose efflux permease